MCSRDVVKHLLMKNTVDVRNMISKKKIRYKNGKGVHKIQRLNIVIEKK